MGSSLISITLLALFLGLCLMGPQSYGSSLMFAMWVSIIILGKSHCVCGAILWNPPLIDINKIVFPLKPPQKPTKKTPLSAVDFGISHVSRKTARPWAVALEDGAIRDFPGIVHWAHQQQVDASGFRAGDVTGMWGWNPQSCGGTPMDDLEGTIRENQSWFTGTTTYENPHVASVLVQSLDAWN